MFRFLTLFVILQSAYSLIEVNSVESNEEETKFIVFTVASENNDAYQRFTRSLKLFGMDDNLQTLGMNKEWKGGDMRNPGGGYKINLLKEAMVPYKDDTNTIVMFSDSYDVIFLADKNEILDKFYKSEANFVISAEDLIWPDRSLKSKYPKIEGKQYLCSGLMIGYANTFWKILNYEEVKNTDDDQLFYTHAYIDDKFREENKIKLDGTVQMFFNLNGALNELEMGFGNKRITNLKYGTMPCVLHGNGPMKLELNRISNYYPEVFDPTVGDYGECLACNEDRIDVSDEEKLPVILTNLFIRERTPFLDYFINKTFELHYPKSKWHMRIYNLVPSQSGDVEELVNYHVTNNHDEDKLASFELFQPQDIEITELQSLYEFGMQECTKLECDWYFALDSDITIIDNDVLLDLMSYNKSVITTQLTIPGQYWSNFWGAINEDGFYRRSVDYFDMVLRKRRSVFNVPYVTGLLAIRSDVIKNSKVSYINNKFGDSNYDVAFSDTARKNNVFMFAVNTKKHGHFKKLDNYTSTNVHNDLWQIFVNPVDWKLNYIDKDYDKFLTFKRPQFPSPCPDVFMFPLVSEKFTWHIINELESIPNIFSSGQNQDNRLAGGYENVPTVDVHFTQINFQQEWLKVLKDYISPIQRLVFEGYSSKNDAYLSFVVKYDMSGQRKLVPHHDASTFTTNTALNRKNIDFEGGGSYFIRQNCLVGEAPIGWTLMHPGRLTHYHEGKEIRRGTRYILVSFNDP